MTEKKALEELLNKVDYEGGWDAFIRRGFSPADYPGAPQRVLDSMVELYETLQQWWARVVALEDYLLEEYGVEL